eukprot:COSAG01_NODE_25230_length_751_cov_2.845092_1_plen_89_part_01
MYAGRQRQPAAARSPLGAYEQVLTGDDMRAMGMADLAGLADGDLSPDSLAALEVRGCPHSLCLPPHLSPVVTFACFCVAAARCQRPLHP